MKLFKKKYEYSVKSAHENHIDSNMVRWEKQGWEVCGDPHVKYHEHAAYMYFPMRRRKNNQK